MKHAINHPQKCMSSDGDLGHNPLRQYFSDRHNNPIFACEEDKYILFRDNLLFFKWQKMMTDRFTETMHVHVVNKFINGQG